MSTFNIISLSYLFSRLSPFIIVIYFVLQSVFNQNLKGLFYVAGVLLACFLNYIVNEILPKKTDTPLVCSLIDGMPNLPLGQTILGFTFAYLSYIIVKYKLTSQNSPTFVLFPILILADLVWNYSNDCVYPVTLFASLAVGSVFGILWGMVIDSVDPELQYFNGIGNRNVCSRPSSTLYRCRITGQPTKK
uniref:Phosphatidic acid phosphatase type 2/haloperoxidase domain-containing protein n=1 Tax=viral metagenome TaxID=1070528 RepID=A0A6C0F1C5_9ZZZZ